MDWISIAVAGSAGGLGASAAYLIVRRPKQRPIRFLILSLALIALLHVAGRVYILDPLNAKRIDEELLQAIADIPVYHALLEHDRVEYDRLTGSLRESLIAGRSRDETVARAQAHDADLCYRFVYPQDGVAVDLRAYVDEETRTADVAALAQVIRTAAANPRDVPSAADVEADLLIVYQGLRETYGEEVDLLAEPTGPDVDRAKICALLISFYGTVLELPESTGGRIIRYLFSDSE